jgi:hypothetical protein
MEEVVLADQFPERKQKDKRRIYGKKMNKNFVSLGWSAKWSRKYASILWLLSIRVNWFAKHYLMHE